MKLHLSIALVLGLVACKKDKDDKPADKPEPDQPPVAVTVDAAAAAAVTPDAGAPTAATGDELKLTWKVPAVGSVFTKQEDQTTDAVLTIKGQNVPVQFIEKEVRHIKVLEATDVMTKVEAHYEVAHQIQRSGGKDKTVPSVLEGKKYVVWSEAGALKATHDDGSALTPEETEEIADELDDGLGRVKGIVQVLTSRGWKVGAAVPLDEPQRRALEADLKKGATILDGTITLDKVDGKTAVFVVALNIDAKGELTGTMTSSVTATIDTEHLRPVTLEITGTVDATAGNIPMKGTVAGTERYTYP